MKKKAPTILLVIAMLVGLSLLLYPTVSDYWNSFRQTTAIMNYADYIDSMDPEERQRLLDEAAAYNQQLFENGQTASLSEEKEELYNSILNWDGTGMMGYIEIPSINVYLPIYHGTDDAVLQEAIGHLNWTSLPVGGESSHSVLSGHRGLPSAKLFTDIVKLQTGDQFRVIILEEVFTYEVDQILTVEPQELQDLRIVEGEDYCTLLTCTPYGINTERLLVRGHRIENEEEAQPVQELIKAERRKALYVAGGAAIAIIVIVIIYIVSRKKRKAR